LDQPGRPNPSLGDNYPVAGLMRAVLERGKAFRFEARGRSMHPFIQDGDMITVRSLAAGEPRTGDIVAFVHPATGGVRIHRVVRSAEGGYQLKGDNVLGEDGLFSRDAILGRVLRVERGGRVRRLGPRLRAAGLARLSRSWWFTRLFRRARRALPGREGSA
jgi:SOS-response transcriptional repressor LexA